MIGGGVVVTKSTPVLVVPSPASCVDHDDTVIPLSSFDKCVVPFPVTALLAYDRPIHAPADTIKHALARALAHYRPLAGRYATGADGREIVGLSCAGDVGVTFVSASASSDLEVDSIATNAALLRDLAVYYHPAGEACAAEDPLVQVQVTEFACGGFVLAATWNHVAADGAGMAQFLRAVAELAGGVSPAPSVLPVRRWHDGGDEVSLPASMVAAQKSTMDHDATRNDELAHLDVTVPGSLVRRVRAESGGGATVFEAVAAVLWRCRTRAVMAAMEGEESSESLAAPLAFPCNMRKHAGAAEGYYGNCVAVQVVPATRKTVAGSSVGELARLIREAKEKAPDILLSRSRGGGNGGVAAGEDEEQPQAEVGWYDAVAVVSWRNLGFDKVDFGGGGPARVMWYGERNVVPGCVVCPPPAPCTDDDDDDGAVRVSSVFLKPEHVDAFLGELAGLAGHGDRRDT